ncbi:CoA transferase [Microbacterium sp. X-17]|uniref:CoA transferase n=1 Tax=Microbacterium sp. X-17 TaxID=3144404 RepID=UPI0031F5B0F5
MPESALPLADVRVVEIAVGVSDVGLGAAGGIPGKIFADLGASVTRVVGERTPEIDEHVEWGRVWHARKSVVATGDADEIRALLADADVAFVYGDEADVEERALGWADVSAAHPELVYVRCRPSRTARGAVADYGLLVEANAGFCSQLAGHRPGPILVDVRASTSGAAYVLTSSALVLLRQKVLTGTGGWADGSLYDGMLSTLGCMIGRPERANENVEAYFKVGNDYPNFMFDCGDGELIQVWFGGKGMYDRLIEVMGDEPSTAGYYVDQSMGRLPERAARWQSRFLELPRDEWLERLRAAGIGCEPVLGPGEVLAHPQARETGLAVEEDRDGSVDVLLGTPIEVTPGPQTDAPVAAGNLLAGLKVVDFSAFIAGPLAAEVLADLGADVLKVEPPGGDAMRSVAHAVAASHRGKRSLALDLGRPEARPVVERLLAWADVVIHNFRVGVAERLGIGADAALQINPGIVYCHSTALGDRGARVTDPSNDALVQALAGVERANGGAGNRPIAANWTPVDVAGGWLAACGTLAGLYARAVEGRGQKVVTSLLGAGMLVHSDVFLRDGGIVRGPELDGDQTGYGPGYRMYRGAGDGWLALVTPDADAWSRLRALVPELPERFTPLRGAGNDAEAVEAERVLERAIAQDTVETWMPRLAEAGILAEVVVQADRDQFRRGILDDPVNRQLARAVAYETEPWGRLEQIGPLLRTGPLPGPGPTLRIPGVGEHTTQALAELGFETAQIDALVAEGVARVP